MSSETEEATIVKVETINAKEHIKAIQEQKTYLDMQGTMDNVKKEFSKMKVTDEKTEANVLDKIKEIKVFATDMDDYRKQLIKEYYDVYKTVNDYFNPKIKEIKSLENDAKRNVLAPYYNEQERVQREEEARIKKENDAKLEKFNKKVDKVEEKGKSADHIPTPVLRDIPTGHTTTVTNNSKSTRVKIKKWKIEDADSIPREFLMIDEKKINRVFKDISIAGIKVYEETQVKIG